MSNLNILRLFCFGCNKIVPKNLKMKRNCYLVHRVNQSKVFLPHEQIVTLGRNVQTQVEDIFVSKKQIECIANNENCTVKVKPVGKAICGVDGYAVVKDKTYTLGPGHIIELRLGYHPFEIVFESDENEDNIKHVAKKMKLDSDTTITPMWEHIGNKDLLIYTPEGVQSQNKVAAFDIDGTIIKTKSGSRFPKDENDWVFNYNDIPQKIQKLYEENFKIVFFTNQSGVGKDNNKIKDFKIKIESIVKKLAVPIQVFVALSKTIYRKPATGMWNILENKKNNDIKINISDSFYVGDAAGREKNWAPKKNKDHSLADRLFAMNIGLKFFTPEEYFRKQHSVQFKMPEFDPRTFNDNVNDFKIDYDSPNVIVMVGLPGSGKSHVCRNILVPKGYIHINRDTLGSWQKCAKLLEDSLQSNKNCVVDNTNCDKESRKRYIDIAKKYNIPCRCFVMSTPYHHAKHNNKFRELTDNTHIAVNDIVINNLKKNYQVPDVSEGFSEVVEVPFIPYFDNKEQEKLYRTFLLEK